ncbi:MAG: PAS domain S-box protein [Candidatus Neomarinimicrobiota bacterium]
MSNNAKSYSSDSLLDQNDNLKLGRLFLNLPGFVYRCLFDEKWTMEFMSNGCVDVTGYEPLEIISNYKIPFVNIIHKSDRKMVLRAIKDALKRDSQFDIEYRIINKSGEEIWVWERGICYSKDRDGHYLIEGYITDITEKKMNEIKLKESRKLYKDLVEFSPDGIIIFDGRGNIHAVNKRFCDLSGYAEKDFIGKNVLKIPTQIRGNINAYKKLIDSILKGNNSKNIYFNYKDKNANIRLAHGRGEVIKVKERKMIMGVVSDISDRDDEHHSLINNKIKAEALLNATPDIMFVLDANGTILDIKSDESDLLYQSKDIINKDIYSILPQDVSELTRNNISETLRTGKMTQYQYSLDIPFKGLRHYEARVVESGNEQVVAIIRDISERKEMELDLIKAKERAEEGNRLKSAFLANMNHEIRTPMNAIIGFADLLQEDQEKEQQRKYLNLIKTSSNYLLRLIEDVLFYSKLQSVKIPVKKTSIDLNKILEDLYETYINSEKVKSVNFELKIDDACKDLMFSSDREKIWGIMTTFINNALKYTQGGFVRIGAMMKGENIRFYVQDSGCGIPEEEKGKIFERFYRSELVLDNNIGGTGLGLSIAKELAKLLETTIHCDSEVDKGSCFYFDLHYSKSTQERSKGKEQVPSQLKLHDLKVLLAEDDEVSVIYMKEILKDMVFSLDHASNGKIAVEMCKQKHYDCILMDMKMPVMGGLEATKIIKALYPDLPIIAQTAFTQSEEKELIFKAGADAYLSKPITIDDLKIAIFKFCISK